MQMSVEVKGGQNIAWIALQHPQVARNALNVALKSARTYAAEAVVLFYNIQKSRVQQSGRLTLRYATEVNLVARMLATGKATRFMDYRPQDVYPRGVQIIIKRAAGVISYPHAFQQTMRSGHVGIFHRVGQKVKMRAGSAYAGRMRQPIKEMFGGTVGQMMTDTGVWDWLTRYAYDKLRDDLQIEYRKFTAGIGRYAPVAR